MPETVYDVVIIGSGPAGYTAAIRAGQYGLKATLIEKDNVLGGTCLHVGCIPTKALLFNAEIWDHLKDAKEFGIEGVDSRKLNWAAIQERKSKIVAKHTKGLDFLMKKNKVEVIRGYGRLTGPAAGGMFTVEVKAGDGKASQIKAKNVILSTGSEARKIPGLEPGPQVLTNIEILDLAQIPKSLIVVGAGAVGVEFASIFRSLDTKVTIVRCFRGWFPWKMKTTRKNWGVSIASAASSFLLARKWIKLEDEIGVNVTFTVDGKQQKIEAEKILIAIGRKPRTENIGLEKTRVQSERGFIKTDKWMQMAQPGIYAIGDIVMGTPQLAHVGAMEGLVAVSKIAGKESRPIDPRKIPNATYCHPEIGSVGLTEAKAKAEGHSVKVGKFPFYRKLARVYRRPA